MAVRDLIFDLDDTLIESFPCYVKLHRQIAGELGWRVPSRRDLIEYGETWRGTLAVLWPGQDLDPFVARYDELADDHPYGEVPGAGAALQQLHAAGHRLWVVTKRDRLRLDQRMLEARLDPVWFRGVFCNDDVPEPKPSPRCFEPIAQALGHAPVQPVYVGDRDDDRIAAEAAGIEFIAVRTGPEADLGFPHTYRSTHVLESVAGLPGWLRANG